MFLQLDLAAQLREVVDLVCKLHPVHQDQHLRIGNREPGGPAISGPVVAGAQLGSHRVLLAGLLAVEVGDLGESALGEVAVQGCRGADLHLGSGRGHLGDLPLGGSQRFLR